MDPDGPLLAVEIDRLVAALRSSPFLLEIQGVPQHYAWGGHQFIPALLGIPNPDRTPYAELWFGSHPLAPARVHVGRHWVSIVDLVRLAGDGLTGPEVAGRFGPGLPYLLKVLDVGSMLSIQAHPNRAQAREGCRREDAAGLARMSPARNYRDANHKPEASVALTDFWMLLGFRPPPALADALAAIPEFWPVLGPFIPELRRCGTDPSERRRLLRRVYEAAMTAPDSEADRAAAELANRLRRSRAGSNDRQSAEFWVRRALDQFPPRDGHYDRGVVAIFLLNLVHLSPGEAVFIPAGIPHAYLEGVAIETMATSDNVLRGGLTAKHVDVQELMRVLAFDPTDASLLLAETPSPGERRYAAPVEEFAVRCIDLDEGLTAEEGPVHGADTIVVLDGEVSIEATTSPLTLRRGGAAIATHGLQYRLRGLSRARLVHVSVPQGQ